MPENTTPATPATTQPATPKQPAPATTNPSTNQPPSTTKPTTKAPDTNGKTNPNDKKKDDLPTKVRRTSVYADATLVQSHIDQRFSPRYEPIKLMFLTGPYAMQFLDLGCNSMSLVEDQSAEWEYGKGDSIRNTANFKSVSTREFQIELDYFDTNQDIRQLVEANYHMHEIGDEEHTPPDLQMITGTATIDPLICRKVSPTYDHPLPGNRGYRHAVVRLTLEIRPEAGSKHDLAPVVSPTYLTNYKKKTTAAARAKAGIIARTKALLEPCLGEEGTNKVVNLIENNKLTDPKALLQLDPNTFLNLIASGVPKSVLENPDIQKKVKADYALIMAKKENGINPIAVRDIANALLTGNTNNVPAAYLQPSPTTGKTLFETMMADFNVIVDGLLNQKLGPKDPVFDRSVNPTASQRLFNTVSCGIGLRRQGGPLVFDIKGTEASLLKGINDLLANPKTTDEQIKEMFGLPANTPETVIRKLRKSAPYNSKAEFLKEAAPANTQGFGAYNMWAGFSATETKTMDKINEVFKKEGISEEDIKKAFGVSSEDAKKLLKAGAFKDKAAFIAAINAGNPNSRKGEELWTKYQLDKEKKDKEETGG